MNILIYTGQEIDGSPAISQPVSGDQVLKPGVSIFARCSFVNPADSEVGVSLFLYFDEEKYPAEAKVATAIGKGAAPEISFGENLVPVSAVLRIRPHVDIMSFWEGSDPSGSSAGDALLSNILETILARHGILTVSREEAGDKTEFGIVLQAGRHRTIADLPDNIAKHFFQDPVLAGI